MPFSWLFFWRRRPAQARRAQARRAQVPPVRVRMYTRAGCHLCGEAWRILQEAQRRWGFTLDAVDVDTDPRLVELYGQSVPVVTVDDRVRFRGAINRVLLTRLLRAEGNRAGR